MPITGLEYFRIENNKYGIFAATPTRLYYFVGRTEVDEKPLLHQVFSKYLSIKETDTFIESATNLRYSKLQFWPNNANLPNSFVWITEKGITYSRVNN